MAIIILDTLSCVLETAKCMDLEPPFGIAQVGKQLLLRTALITVDT